MSERVATIDGPLVRVTVLHRGGWLKADVKEVSFEKDRAILKDFSDKSWPARLLGRRQVLREVRALTRLQGIPGVPVCYGEAGRFGVLMERVEGERITRWCRTRPDQIQTMFARLVRLVADIHARGVAHIDLRKRDNILIDPAGSPRIIDFNASFCFEPGGSGARFLFPLLRRVDTAAVLKWKARLAPHLLTRSETRRHRMMSALRRLWIFS